MAHKLHTFFTVLFLAFYPFGIYPLKIFGFPVHESLLLLTSVLFIISLFSQKFNRIDEFHYIAFVCLGLIFVLDSFRLAVTGAQLYMYSGLLYYLTFAGIVLYMTERRALLYLRTLMTSSCISFIILMIHNSGNSSRYSYYFGNGFDRFNMVDPNILSYGFIISFVAAIVMRSYAKVREFYPFIFFCICLYVVINTQSRSAFGALIICSLLWYVNSKFLQTFIYVAPFLIISAIVFAVNNLNLSSLVNDLDIVGRLSSNAHGEVRLAILIDVYVFLTSSASNLIIGSGWRTSNPHNIIVFIAASIGILGFTAMSTLAVMIFAKAKSISIRLKLIILSGTLAPLIFYHSDKVMFASLLLLACSMNLHQSKKDYNVTT